MKLGSWTLRYVPTRSPSTGHRPARPMKAKCGKTMANAYSHVRSQLIVNEALTRDKRQAGYLTKHPHKAYFHNVFQRFFYAFVRRPRPTYMSDFLPEAFRRALRANQKKFRSDAEATGILDEVSDSQGEIRLRMDARAADSGRVHPK